MSLEQRFQLGALETPEDDPGLTLAGGTVYAVAPGGARTAVGGGGGASFPPEWTVGGDGSLEIAPSGPTSTPLVLRGSASGSTLFGITDETGDVQMLRFDSDSMLTVADENGYGGQFGASALGGTYIFPPPELTDPVFKVFDTDGNTAFQIDADGKLVLVSQENGLAEITGGADGVQISVRAPDGAGVGTGGEITIFSGDGVAGDGGDVTIGAGGSTDGAGGNVTITSGPSTNSDGGEIRIQPNAAGAAGETGGQLLLQGGPGDSNGGDVIVKGGSTNGSVQIYSGDSNKALELNNSGLFLPDVIDGSSLPTVNPGVAGQIWSDAGTLKVSAG